MTFQDRTVLLNGHRIYVRDLPGEGSRILLMHGFPDNLHLYDRVVPHLAPTRRVVTFDFLGWGAMREARLVSDHRPETASRSRDRDRRARAGGPVLVVHDDSGHLRRCTVARPTLSHGGTHVVRSETEAVGTGR